MCISDWSSDVCSSYLFETVGANIEAADPEIGGLAIDFIARIGRIILAVARVGLVFAIVEFFGHEVGNILGRILVAQREFLLGIMPPLKVQPDEQTARTNRAAVNQAEARFEFLVVLIEPARAAIASVKPERDAQLAVDRARAPLGGPACRRPTDDCHPGER